MLKNVNIVENLRLIELSSNSKKQNYGGIGLRCLEMLCERSYRIIFGKYRSVWQCITALGIKPSRKEDGEWCFHYGYTNGQDDGISGFGRTINEAAMDFFVNMKYDNGSYFSESEFD